MSTPPLVTFGHSTADHLQLTALLRPAHIASVLDIRSAPGSRHNPDAGRERLQQWLPAAGIAYRWERRLGGFRTVRPDSPDTIWRNASFRGYAGYTRDPAFLAAVDQLLQDARTTVTAIMCGEALWWRCHRRIVADFAVVARHYPVLHLMRDGRMVRHTATPGVRLREDGPLVYDDTAAAERRP